MYVPEQKHLKFRTQIFFSLTVHFNMANAMIRRHLSEAEMWRAIEMAEHRTTHCQVGVALGGHHTVFTRAWLRYQQYGTHIKRHDGGRQRVTTAVQG